MIATVLLAAALPLGIWPSTSGDAAAEKNGVEFYLVEPEDDYWIIAVQPLSPPLDHPDAASLKRLATTADALGADAVLLLEELPAKGIPKDTQAPLVGTGHLAEAVYITFDCGCDEGTNPPAARGAGIVGSHHARARTRRSALARAASRRITMERRVRAGRASGRRAPCRGRA
jgi:hypothetical protein